MVFQRLSRPVGYLLTPLPLLDLDLDLDLEPGPGPALALVLVCLPGLLDQCCHLLRSLLTASVLFFLSNSSHRLDLDLLLFCARSQSHS